MSNKRNLHSHNRDKWIIMVQLLQFFLLNFTSSYLSPMDFWIIFKNKRKIRQKKKLFVQWKSKSHKNSPIKNRIVHHSNLNSWGVFHLKMQKSDLLQSWLCVINWLMWIDQFWKNFHTHNEDSILLNENRPTHFFLLNRFCIRCTITFYIRFFSPFFFRLIGNREKRQHLKRSISFGVSYWIRFMCFAYAISLFLQLQS